MSIPSLIAQRVDRVDIGCFERWIGTENDADKGADHQAVGHPVLGKNDRRLEQDGQNVSASHSQHDPDDTA